MTAEPASRFDRAIAEIDRANADDPFTVVVDGVERPKEQAHAELMSAMVARLDPDADDLSLLAARAHHLRRWTVPRSSHPDGRAGYLRWRAALARQHGDEVGVILERCGYGSDEVLRVQRIVRKEGLGTDPAVQVHEDARCLVFLQTQLAGLLDRLGHDHAVSVVAKTIAKMSEAGIDQIAALDLPAEHLALVAEAAGST